MNRELGLKILCQIMDWTDEVARNEFRWLTFMSAYKYDGYRDYSAGARFIECLAKWLQQFKVDERHVAYNFIKDKLIFFSFPEILRLVEKFFPEYVQQDVILKVSKNICIPKYQIWATEASIREYKWELRKTLFMGLSDGARIDTLRRVNVGLISNDQIVIATQIDANKWRSLITDLNKDLSKIKPGDWQKEKFSRVYLIDDFIASGTSLLRELKSSKKRYDGKLVKFAESLSNIKQDLNGDSPFTDDFEIFVHHYIGTKQVHEKMEERFDNAKKTIASLSLLKVKFTYGMILTSDYMITEDSNDPFVNLCKSYYDQALEGKGEHGEQSGVKSKMFGYANCGLPVVIEHNTPNNSLPLLWAETKGEKGHKMRPLFRRRERFSDLGRGNV